MTGFYRLMLVLALCAALALAQAADPSADQVRGQAQDQEPRALSKDVTADVARILSQYDPDQLTPEQARAINNAFRAAGICRGRAQQAAVRAAGFDPEKVRALDPPPVRSGPKEVN